MLTGLPSFALPGVLSFTASCGTTADASIRQHFSIPPDMFVPLILGQVAAVEVFGDLFLKRLWSKRAKP